MKNRYKVNRRKDRKFFAKTASMVNEKNVIPTPMRGGYRL